jgi:ubiquinone/menaquinone biosynthesis C-methylase UbiE
MIGAGAARRLDMRRLALVLIALSYGAAAQTVHTPEEAHHVHHDSQAYIAMLEDPARDAYQKPADVVKSLALRSGETIADIGAGSGYFAVRFAPEVGPSGHVLAVDVEPDMVRYLNRRIRDASLWQIRTVLAPPDDPLLGEGTVDRFFICDTWHHIDDQKAYLERMKRMLKPGGQIVMIDFQKRELPVGPPLAMKIAREDLVKQMEAFGFRVAREETFLPYQYFLVFVRT